MAGEKKAFERKVSSALVGGGAWRVSGRFVGRQKEVGLWERDRFMKGGGRFVIESLLT